MTAPSFTVLIPTHDHADTLWYAIGSVLAQTRQDFEIFIVGDGVPERTREIVATLRARDQRIRFFDNPKGERHGEAHRHAALREASGRFVCYQADDDLWFPDHLERMASMLEGHDLAHTMQIELNPDGRATTWMFDARLPGAIDRMRRSESGFGLASGGHTLQAYRRLPHGWFPAPKGINTDLHFWLQFLDQAWCRYTSGMWPSVCHLSSVPRCDWSSSARIAELSAWWPRVRDANGRSRIVEAALSPLFEFPGHQAPDKHDQPQVGVRAEIEALRDQLAAVHHSASWRLTAPLRRIAELFIRKRQ